MGNRENSKEHKEKVKLSKVIRKIQESKSRTKQKVIKLD